MLKEINESVAYIEQQTNFKAHVAIVLGTGLGDLISSVAITHTIAYENIPHFPLSTVESHSGKLVFGELNGVNVVIMQGRFHYYEGYSMQQIAFPIRVLSGLGIKKILLSNAAGGINPSFKKGDLVIVNDHINLFNGNPLIGKNEDSLGSRFVDMCAVYDQDWINLAMEILQQNNLLPKTGVYAGLSGPMLETPAEYKFLAVIGADLVGMSTIPEVIAAKHLGMQCLVCSIVTDVCYGIIQPVAIQEIIKIANQAQPKLVTLFKELLPKL